MSTFQIIALDLAQYLPFFDLTDEELQVHSIARQFADKSPGYPCRISLEDAAVGEEVLLFQYDHHAVKSPYRSSGPMYIRRTGDKAVVDPDFVPTFLLKRTISLRCYDKQQMMISATVCQGDTIANELRTFFQNLDIVYIHIHNARTGCYLCAANRVGVP